jgi:dephospho-CoA kinase
MIKVGVTGGIGSGKSLVCNIFSRLQAPVYSSDEAAKALMDSDPEIRKDLTELLGVTIYTGNRLDRNKMAGLIFTHTDLLEQVNRIVHPRVATDFEQWCHRFRNTPYIIHESAILIESGAYRSMDRIVLVTAPEPVRSARINLRPGMTGERIRSVMNNQLPDEEKIKFSNYIINNDGLHMVLPQVLEIHEELVRASATYTMP